MDKEENPLPARLREARKRAGVGVMQAAEELGIRRAAIWEMETGKRKCKDEEIAGLADLYGVSPSWLLGRARSTARDDRVARAADYLSGLTHDALFRLELAIRIIKEQRNPSLPPI